MIKFIEKPNLPKGQVSSLICGKIPQYLSDFFTGRGIMLFECAPNCSIDPAVKNHADMDAVHLGGTKVVVAKDQTELIEKLKDFGCAVFASQEEIKGNYPDDVKLNVALFGKFAIGNFKYTDKSLSTEITAFEKIQVKQGYAKCSVLPVSENAVITDDVSIFNALKKRFDTLLVSKGDIFLEGHEYGFIGGASAKISESEVLFFGDITKHRDYGIIADFLGKHSCEMLCFHGLPLSDLGGIVSLTER